MKQQEIKQLYAMMFPDYPDIVNVAQLQKMLGISRHCAYSLIRDGYIPGILIGNSYKVPKKNIIDYVFGSTADDKQEVPVWSQDIYRKRTASTMPY